MMDGGRGQVNMALRVLDKLGLADSCLWYGQRMITTGPEDLYYQ